MKPSGRLEDGAPGQAIREIRTVRDGKAIGTWEDTPAHRATRFQASPARIPPPVLPIPSLKSPPPVPPADPPATCIRKDEAYVAVESRGSGLMNGHVLEVSTYVFRLLRRRELLCITCSDEKDGPTQRIVVEDDVYSEIIDRAIAKRKSIDEVFLEFVTRGCSPRQRVRCIKRWRL